MPTEAVDIHSIVHKNGTATLLARVVGADGSAVQQADIASGVYSIYLIDEQDEDSRTAVTGHGSVSLTIASTIHDTLQTDAIWTEDDTGYNFSHTIDISSAEAFAIAGRKYLAEVILTPASGQVIVVRWLLSVI